MRNEVAKREAVESGLKHYFTGKPCKRGHIAERSVSNRTCVDCTKIRKPDADKRYYKKYATNIKANVKKYAELNREKILSSSRAYSKNNSKSIIAKKRLWRDKNISHVRAKARQYAITRKAKKLGVGGEVVVEQINILLKKQNYKCIYCLKCIRKKNEADHIIALANGGLHHIDNIQMLCQPCNRSKHTKDPITWAQEKHGVLL